MKQTSWQRARNVLANYQGSGTPQLPPGWQVFQDDVGQIYYGNIHTGETQWEAPGCEPGDLGQQPDGSYMQQARDNYAFALEDVALAEERLKQSVEYSPCNGPSMEAVEELEAADERLALAQDYWLSRAAEHAADA